jgi:NTE family protein
MQHDLTDDRAVSFALGGGNALGAYHLGVCERLFAAGILPSWIAGTSIGAVTGAILVGNPPQTRLARLREFWNRAAQIALPEAPLPPEIRARINNDYALAALLFGRPGLFGSRFPGIWSLLPGMPPDRALRDHAPLARTLEDLIDFDRLNAAPERLSIVALDMETGEEVWFDNRHGAIGPEHLLAATALAPLFPPVEIDGRLLCDAGFGNNLPFDRIFREPPPRETLCIAVDAYTLAHGRPATLDETVARVQDLAFASQTRRALARRSPASGRSSGASTRRAPARRSPTSPIGPAGHQRTLKPLDFSRASLDERVEAGLADAEAILDRLARAPRGQPLTYLGPLAPETG